MKKITIVGGGLVGSLLASYLGKRRFDVAVFERRPDMRKVNIPAGKSINMACSTRGWKALDKIGVGDKIREAAIAMNGRMIHSKDGKLSFQPYGKNGQAIYSISRGGLNKILISFAEENNYSKFHFNEKCESVDLDSATVKFTNQENGKTHEIKSDFVFGADGAFSAVRQEMTKVDRFTYSQTYIEHCYKELNIPAVKNDFALEKNALHIWPRGNYMLIALPNPDKSFTCTLFLPFDGKISFSELNNNYALVTFFAREFPDALSLMPTLEKDFFTNATSSLCLINCNPWSYKNKVCLIGDACHAIVPFHGQGMIAGFEDCDVLDDCIEKYGDDWNTILKEFESSRKPNTDAIAQLTLNNFVEMRDLVGDPKFLYRKEIEKKLHDLYPENFIPLYSMVSFSNIPYAKALELGIKQDKLLEKIMTMNGVEKNLDSPEVKSLVEELTV